MSGWDAVAMEEHICSWNNAIRAAPAVEISNAQPCKNRQVEQDLSQSQAHKSELAILDSPLGPWGKTGSFREWLIPS